MSIGLIGRKLGVTRVFDDSGNHTAVTVIQIEDNVVSQIKTVEKDGYNAVQVSYGSNLASRLNKSQLGLYSKTGVPVGEKLAEFRLSDVPEYAVSDVLSLDIFSEVAYVDCTSVSKGKGFQGGVKRHNFKTQDATHGNSLSHRAIGSTGQNQSPGKVFKGKKMPGQMGSKQVTVMSQKLVKVDAEKKLLLVEGSISGATGTLVKVRKSIKK